MSEFIIGITGHRELPENKQKIIEQTVKEFFAKMRREHGEEITVLSSLAEGADILCAKLALNMGLRLVAPLPMSISEYRRDFSGKAAAELDSLLFAASEVLTVPHQEVPPANPTNGFYYRQAGIYVASNCNILLALWNEKENNTPDGAGTWETIKLAREKGKAVQIVPVLSTVIKCEIEL